VPTVFIVAAAGSGVMLLPWWQLGLILLGLVLGFWLLSRYKERLVRWVEQQVGRRLS
jgi:positive regulator of sigma E activity